MSIATVNMQVFRCILCQHEWQEIPQVPIRFFSEQAARSALNVTRLHNCVTPDGQRQVGVVQYIGLREVAVSAERV